MKLLSVSTLALCVFTASSSMAQSDNRSVRRNVYTSECTYSAPLYTIDRCDEYSHIGRIVADCAYGQAMDNCRSDFNSDCIEKGVQVWQQHSQEFVGYKVCKARARVHGYEPR